MASLIQKIPAALKSWWAITLIVLVVLGGGYYFFARSGGAQYQFIAVTRGTILETVSVTGNTTPVESVSLGFGAGGTVARVNAKVGDHVSPGALLASLDMSDLSAQLKQAQANVDSQNAKLAGLTAGSRPEDIAAAQAAYDKSLQDLANLYSGVSDTASDAYAKANDAVRTQLSAFFSNAETSEPSLTFSTFDSQSKIDAQTGRVSAGVALTAWQNDASLLNAASSQSVVVAAIASDLGRLQTVRDFLTNAGTALNAASNLDVTTLAAYKADVAAAVAEVNTAIKNLNTASQTIASQNLTVTQLKAQLDLKKAGSTPQDIAAQQAQVANAEAAVESIQAKMRNSQIVAPIGGVVTQFDAKTGQIAASGVALVSIISDSAFEIDADVPETDIGKVSVGDPVSMTLDAFPGETFDGSVFYIDPAQTITQGVVTYKVKSTFAKPDSRMKSGLTVNLDIETKKHEGVLVLPQYAILQNDAGNFVEVLQSKTATNTPVTLGIEDQKGNVEILSGVTEGEKVINIGLK